MKDIYVVSSNEWDGSKYVTEILWCFECGQMADDYVKSMQTKHKKADKEFKVEIVEIITC
jgi:hypothetical protein